MANQMRSGGTNGMHPAFASAHRAAAKALDATVNGAAKQFNQTIKSAAAAHGHTTDELSNRGLLLNEDDDG